MLNDQEISAIVDRLWEPCGPTGSHQAVATDIVFYDSREGAIGIGAPASASLPSCLGAMRAMRVSERFRLDGLDGEVCVLVGEGCHPGTSPARAAGILMVRDGQISRCELWIRPGLPLGDAEKSEGVKDNGSSIDHPPFGPAL